MKTISLHDEIILHSDYMTNSAKNIALKINKNRKAVYELARKRNLKKVPNWTVEQIFYLLTKGSKETSKKFNKSYNSCNIKKHRLCKLHTMN